MTRVASLNICGLPSRLPSPKVRAAAYCRWFEQSDVDVVNLQEVWSNNLLRFIRDRTPSFTHVAWRRGIAGQPAGGLVTFSRLPLSAVSFTSLAGISPQTGSPLFRILKAINSRLQGVLIMELTGRQTVVGNTHLSANRDGDWSEGNRHFGFQRAQLQALQQAMQKASFLGTRKVVLCGDFNISSSSPLYPLVVDGGRWLDPFGLADRATFHGGGRIDYLLVGGDTQGVTDAVVLFEEPVVSDHMGLAARVA